ncbi:hypothetical protein UFOVP1233_3 [uncultured Caudovirales phage]|uniref:Uncharacterized protein n=1 Tax=uncultured Caudovirales phage TaxID=2100421 RepID=A0A6J5R405_9CAUD|nr:hypothetical protein UFOVP1233_3 [uncultured Caudovirales phage]
MSLYADFLADAKVILADFGVAGSANSGAITFVCMLSDPSVTQVFEAGGFCERTQHTVRLAAATASWSLPDGSNGASAAVISGGLPIASLAIGKKIVAGGKSLRITGQTYKPASAWITLVVIDDNQ